MRVSAPVATILAACSLSLGCSPLKQPEVLAQASKAQVLEPRSPREMISSAERALILGQNDEALRITLRCFDQGPDADGAFGGIWGTSLPRLMAELHRIHPPARAPVAARLVSVERRIAAADPASASLLLGLVELYRALGQTREIEPLAERLLGTTQLSRTDRGRVLGVLSVELEAAARYDLLAGHAEAMVEASLGLLPYIPAERPDLADRLVFKRSGIAYFALLHEGELDRAISVGDRILEAQPAAAVYTALLSEATRAEHPHEIERILQKARSDLPEGDWRELERSFLGGDPR